MRERLFRGDVFEHERSRREDFDPIAEGKRYGLAPEVSAALWEHVRREATDSAGVCDENAAPARFAQLAELIARRGGQLGSEPFHWAQIDVASGRLPPDNFLAERVPGRTTLVLAEASARARVALGKVPGRTTLVAHHTTAEVGSLDESQGFFRRYVNGGHAGCAKLERAIAARDHYASVIATSALKQDLASARRHLANGLERDEGLRAEFAAFEGLAEQLLAKLPNMSAGGRPWEFWGPSSAEWRAAIGDDAERADGLPQAGTRLDEPRAPQRLPASLQCRMERAYGRQFDEEATDTERFYRSADAPRPALDREASAWRADDLDSDLDGDLDTGLETRVDDHGGPPAAARLTGVSRGTPSTSPTPSHAPSPLELARAATTGGGSALPHLGRIQDSFGRHDVSGLRAHDGDVARRGAVALGARAFAVGDDLAFSRAPDLHTAAHEAAHAIQQRAGLVPAGGVGVRGDALERHADRVAAAVVAGRSAERLLDRAVAGRSRSTAVAVQRKDEVGTLYDNDVAVELDHGTEAVAFLIPLTQDQKAQFAANPDLANSLARDVAYMFTRGGQPRPESKAFLESEQISDMIGRDLDSWLRGKGFPTTYAFLDQRQAALDGLRLIAPLERWLAQQGIAAGTVDWRVVTPQLLAMPVNNAKDMFEASAEDRYRTVLQGIANEASQRPSVTGATVKAETLAPLARAFAGTLSDADLGNTVTTHSEAFLKKWAPEIASLPYVPSGFDVERFKPTTTKDALESHRKRIIAEFKRTRMPNLIVQYVRDNWSGSRQTPDNYLKHLDMKALRTSVIAAMTRDFVELGKTDPEYRRALASASHDQARYDSLKQLAILARRIETNHRNLPQRLLKGPGDLDASDAAIAANPFAYLETARSLSVMTTTIFSRMQNGGDKCAALATIPNTELNRMFGAVTVLIALGTAIKDLRQTHADQEEETRRDLNRDLNLQYDDVAKIVQTMWDDAEKWIDEIYIPKLKQVAIRILTQNRDELANWDKNWNTETSKVIATYKVAAFALRDIAKKLASGEATSVSIQDQTITVKDLEQIEQAAKTMDGLADSLSSKDGAADKRKELREAVAAFDRTKEKINNGDHPPWAWGHEVATVARAELGIGEFPEYSTYYMVFTGQVQASKNPFIARAIAGWQFREKLEAEFKELAIMVGLGLLSVASVLVPGVGALILGALDIGLNVWHAKAGLDQAKAALDLALLDPHLKLQGLTVDQARKALHSAKIAMVLSIVIPLGVAALAGLLIWRLGRGAKQLGSGFEHFDAAFKKDPTRVQSLLEVFGDIGRLDKLLALTKDAKVLDELLLHAGSAANVEKFLAKIPDAAKLAGFLDKAGSAKRLGSILDHIGDANQLERLAQLYKNNYAKLEQHLLKLAAHGEQATSGTRLENLINKVGSLEKLEPLLATGADLAKVEKLLDTIKAERLTELLKQTKNAENLEKLMKHVSDLDHLERLLAAAKDPGKLLGLLEHANPTSVENILKHVRDADHAADLLKLYGKNVAQLEKHLAALGSDATAGARLTGMLGKTKDVATLEKLIGKAGNDIAGLQKILAHGKVTDMGALERLLGNTNIKDLAALEKLIGNAKVTDLAALQKLLANPKIKSPKDVAALQKILDNPKLADVAALETLLADPKINTAEWAERLLTAADDMTQLRRLLADAKVPHGVDLARAMEQCDTAARFEKLLGYSDDLKQLHRYLDKAGKQAGAAKLEEILKFVGTGNAKKVAKMAERAGGDAGKFTQMVDWAKKLPSQNPPPHVPTAAMPPSAARYGFTGGANMEHFFEHTWEYVNISKRTGKETTFFGHGMDASKMTNLVDEAIVKANAAHPTPALPVHGQPELVDISIGRVQIGSEPGPSGSWIGQFFPKVGETIQWPELEAISHVLK